MTTMSLRTKFWIAAAATFSPIAIGFATPKSAPAWILHVEDGVVLVEGVLLVLLLLAVLVTPARVLDRVAKRLAARRRESAVREVRASNGIDVLRASGIRVIDANEDGDVR